MTDTPKRIGLVSNGLGGWRLWSKDEPNAGGRDHPDAEYIIAAEHDRIVAEKDAEIARLREALGAELAATRDNALEDAARMVDCACECRDAVLAAKTKVDRWTACGRDPCGALDAAAIRAMKGDDNG